MNNINTYVHLKNYWKVVELSSVYTLMISFILNFNSQVIIFKHLIDGGVFYIRFLNTYLVGQINKCL